MRMKTVTALILALLILRLLTMFSFDLAEYYGIVAEKETVNDPLYIENPNQDAFAACLMIMDDNRRLIEYGYPTIITSYRSGI